MLFSSNLFLFLFLPFVVCGYYLLEKKYRNAFLLVVSLIFYAWGEPYFVLVMISSIILNYTMAFLLYRSKKQQHRMFVLLIDVAANLILLFVFKYLDFAILNLNRIGLSIPMQNIALPLGISFFTFQAMSYVIDVYRKPDSVQINPINIGLYIAFFPQLVAGPIVRYQTIMDQIDNRKETFEDFGCGVKQFIIGFAKKIILSNNMALVADAAFQMNAAERSVAFAWMGALAYAFQILFDFSGYSDMAIGLGKMFGFHFLENFDYPYISKSISEFWRRWHISLGQWFRDYVYFPLGGSRVNTKARLVFNLFVVWLLTGIWHGASWTFVAWGLMYFVLIAFEKLSGWPNRLRGTLAKQLYRIFTLLCILVGWVFFRATGVTAAVKYLCCMLGLLGNTLIDETVICTWNQYRYFFVVAVLCSTPIFKMIKYRLDRQGDLLSKGAGFVEVIGYLFILLWSVSFIMIGSHNPFIYFNF